MFEVSILPRTEEENDFRTPCYFTFENIVELHHFLDMIYEHGDSIKCEIIPVADSPF